MVNKTILVSLCLVVPAIGEWLTDLEKAQIRAEEETKDIYLVFTGSDWSQSCQRFEKTILSQESFQSALAERFLLVRVDLPIRSNLPKEVIAAKRKLSSRLAVETWPEAVYLDPQGRPYDRDTGVLPLSVKNYAEHVLAKRSGRKTRDLLFEKADQLEGQARAEAIVEALRQLPRNTLLEFYRNEVAELDRLNPDNSKGFLKSLRAEKGLLEIEQSLAELFNHRSFDRLIEKIDLYLKVHQPLGENRQQALTYKMAAYQNSARPQKALEIALEIISIDEKTDFAKSAVQVQNKLRRKQ